MKTCPHCAEEIQEAANVCKHCGRDLVAVPSKPSKKRTGCFTWIVALLVLPFAFTYFFTDRFAEPAGQEAEQVLAQPQPEPAAPVAEAPAVVAPSVPLLADITSGFVTSQMEGQGMTCEGPTRQATRVAWRCTGSEGLATHVVEMLGQSPTRVEYVTGTILQGTAGQAAQFLAFVASLPYDGADPAATQAWVRENAGLDTERVVGGVKIRLAGPAAAAGVSVFPEGSDWD